MQLLVLGMHRSGTSAVTRVLNMAGAHFGPEGISNGADEGNPKGFWERIDVRAACDGLLQESGFDWCRLAGFSLDAIPEQVRERHVGALAKIVFELDAHRPWVVKEPRLSLLFPLLRPLLEVPVCVHVVREPLEVAESLRMRNGFATPVGLALWEVYTAHAFAASVGLPRIIVRYDDIVREPVETVSQLLGQLGDLGVQGLRTPSDQEITAFLTPDLHRARRSADGRSAWMNGRQVELAAAVDDGSILAEERLREVSDVAAAVLRSFEEDVARRARIEELEAEREALDARLADQEQKVAAHAARSAELRGRVETLNERRKEEVRRRNESEKAAARKLSEAEKAAARRLAEAEDRRRAVERAASSALRDAAKEIRAVRGSRTWRASQKLTATTRLLRPGASRPRRSPLDRALGTIERARREITPPAADDSPPPGPSGLVIRSFGTAPERAVGSKAPSRPTVAVVAWDVGHNPLGRAYALAGILGRRFDVEIWGAQFDRYGQGLWEPLRDIDVPVHVFDGGSFPDHLRAMEQAAERIDADALYVSKPRLPSLALGALAKAARIRPLVLDVDDHELAFFDVDDGIDLSELGALRDDPDLALPFGRAWTRACDRLIAAADAVTVSNVALQQRYGGVIVPHARDERVFDPARYDRAAVRHRLGVSDTDRLLLFGGTPRVHKGVVEVLHALERLGDDRYRLALFGTRELNTLRKQIGDLERWVLPLPYQPFADLAPLVGAADLTCVLQDRRHPVSRYQMPAKVSDALAMGVPCLVSPVAPLQPLIDEGVLHVADGEAPLHESIARVFDDPADAAHRAAMGRKLFLDTYSYDAVSEVLAPTFEGLLADPPPVDPALVALVDAPRRLFAEPVATEADARPARTTGRTRIPITPEVPFDVVVLWKQNDTGIYGRRQDMIVKYLAQSDRVHSILHFDNPITLQHLQRTYRSAHGHTDQRRLVVRQTVERLLHRRDSERIVQRTFLHSGTDQRRFGLPPVKEYPSYVASVMKRHGVGTGARPVVFWVYPTNNHLPRLLDVLDPDLVVADVVDDHRTFSEPGTERYERFERNYERVLARSDVVLANCEPVAEGMAPFTPEVHVIPNGCELTHATASGPPPAPLAQLDGPIIGYVGNLSQRLDIPLLDELVRARPDWQFVFVGSAHHDRTVLRLEAEPNVHFVGVKPYAETIQFIQHFDVALIPHLVNDMTASMNPLKAFVYCSTGVPVVSTPVANLDAISDLITVAEGADGFITAIEAALRDGRRQPDLERLAPHSWDVRVQQAIALIDQASAAVQTP